MIMPASQIVTEPLFYAVAPKGISFHTSRLNVTGDGIQSIAEMEALLPKSVDELVQARVNCIAYLCVTGGMVRGLDREKKLCEEIEERTGIPVVSALLSTFEALNVLGIRKIVIVAPYPKEHNELQRKLFESSGFEVLGVHGLGITNGFAFGQVVPHDIYKFCKRVWDNSAEGLFIGCAAFNAMPIVGRIERNFKVPVVTAHSAVLWKILRILGIKGPLFNLGVLLSKNL